jgi:hypothetical protein
MRMESITKPNKIPNHMNNSTWKLKKYILYYVLSYVKDIIYQSCFLKGEKYDI